MSGTDSGVSSGLQNISSGLGSLSSGLQNASAGSSGQDLSMTGGGANNYWTPQRMANATSMGAYDTGGGVLGAAANQAATGSNQAGSGGNAGMGSMGLVGTPVSRSGTSAGTGTLGSAVGTANRQGVVAAPVNGNYVDAYASANNQVNRPWNAQRMQNAKTNLGNYG